MIEASSPNALYRKVNAAALENVTVFGETEHGGTLARLLTCS